MSFLCLAHCRNFPTAVLLFLLSPPPHTHTQHLWTGPISNAPVEIIQGGRSVEVRPVGVTKGLAMQRILGYMASICGTQVRIRVVCGKGGGVAGRVQGQREGSEIGGHLPM
jgi:hypothetical protein